MRVLLVNKYYYLRSGTERYLFNLRQLLEERDHEVAVFGMDHPQNRPAIYAADFVPPVDFRTLSWPGRLAAALRVIWYPGAARRMARVLDRFRPDVVHLLNVYHHLSPSILVPIARRSIPVVQTLNDYKLICPNYLLYSQGQVCERCRDGLYYRTVQRRCLHGSLAWSVVATIEMTLHKALRVYERMVGRFIAPSRFVLAKAVEFGIPATQLAHLPYFLFADRWSPAPFGPGDYVLFVGRLAKEKGVLTLLSAVREQRIPLVIIGDGPERPAVEAAIARHGLDHVHLWGHLTGRALADAVAGARFTVVPSEWHEVFGQVVIESFARARAVVAAAAGGIPEIVAHGEDGLLVRPGDVESLAGGLERLWQRPEAAGRMGLAGRAKVEARYDAPAHYERIMRVYQEVGY